MAVDTRNKRASAISIGLPWRGLLPEPDGTIDQADRQQVALVYVGILAGEPVVIVPEPPAVIHTGAAGFGVVPDFERERRDRLKKRDLDAVVAIMLMLR